MASDHLPRALQFANDRAERWKVRYDTLRDQVEQLAADVEHSRAAAEDPTILCRDGEWADLQPVLEKILNHR